MKNAFELSRRQMRDITGGGPNQAVNGVGSNKHCFIDGELINETICTSDEECKNVYGSKAKCY